MSLGEIGHRISGKASYLIPDVPDTLDHKQLFRRRRHFAVQRLDRVEAEAKVQAHRRRVLGGHFQRGATEPRCPETVQRLQQQRAPQAQPAAFGYNAQVLDGAGAGVGIVSELVAASLLQSGQLVRVAIAGLSLVRPLSLVHLPGRTLGRLDRELLALI